MKTKLKIFPGHDKKAMVMPVAMFFLFLLAAFGYMLININVQSKKQQRSTIMETKAYFMALAGFQQIKLKYLLLPEVFFTASTLYYGFSPCYVPQKGKKFDLFDDPTKAGPFRYPEFLGSFVEDTNSFLNDPDGSAKEGKTVANQCTLLKTKDKEVKQVGGCLTWNFKIGGFPLEDKDVNDTIEEWGYKIIEMKCGSLQKEIKNGLPVIEQSITIIIEGLVKVNALMGLNPGEDKYKRNVVKETLVLRREVLEEK